MKNRLALFMFYMILHLIIPNNLKAQGNKPCADRLLEILKSCEDKQHVDDSKGKTYFLQLEDLLKDPNCDETTKVLTNVYLANLLQKQVFIDGFEYQTRKENSRSLEFENIDYWTKDQAEEKIYLLLQDALTNISALQKENSAEWSNFFEYPSLKHNFLYSAVLKTIQTTLSSLDRSNLFLKKQKRGIDTDLELISDKLIDFYSENDFRLQLAQLQVEVLKKKYTNDQEKLLIALWDLFSKNQHQEQELIILRAIADQVQGGYSYRVDASNNTVEEYVALFDESEEAVNRWRGKPLTCLLENKLSNVYRPMAEVKIKKIYRNDEEFKLSVVHRFASEIIFFVKKDSKDIYREEIKLDEATFQTLYDSISLPALPFGAYELNVIVQPMATPFGDTNSRKEVKTVVHFEVSNLNTVIIDQKRNLVFVGDSKNGKPIENAEVSIYERHYQGSKPQYKYIDSKLTDKSGYTSIKYHSNKSYEIRIQNANDRFYPPTSMYGNTHRVDRNRYFVDIYPDRSVYSPGEVIQFAGTMMQKEKLSGCPLVSGKEIKVSLMNPSNKLVEEKTVKTDEWGSFALSFDVPEKTRPGRYSINTPYGSQTIEVMEYTAPQLKFALSRKLTKDSLIQFNGKLSNLADLSLVGTKVEYSLLAIANTWMARSLRDGLFDMNESTIHSGEIILSAEQTFMFSINPNALALKPNQLYGMMFQATSPQGKVERSMTYFSIESKNSVSYHLGEDLLKNSTQNFNEDYRSKKHRNLINYNNGFSISVNTNNILGDSLNIKGRLQFVSRKDTTVRYDLGIVETNKKLRLELPASIINRKEWYSLVFEPQQNADSYYNYPIVVGFLDEATKRLPIDRDIILVQNTTKVQAGASAKLYFGSRDKLKNVNLLYFSNDSLIEKTTRNLKPNKTYQADVTGLVDKYQTVKVVLFAMKDGMEVSTQLTFSQENKDEELTIKQLEFPFTLTPKKETKWRFQVVDNKGVGVKSHVTLSMYDQSLDLLSKAEGLLMNSWHYQAFIRPYYRFVVKYMSTNQSRLYIQGNSNRKKCGESTLGKESMLESFCYIPLSVMTMDEMVLTGYGKNASKKSNRLEEKNSAGAFSQASPSIEQSKLMTIPFREDFDATALFIPAIITDEEGYFDVKFKAPDILTKWNVNILAYDKQGRGISETLENETRKLLSINSLFPSFVRNGDMIILDVEISERARKNQKVELLYRVYDTSNQKEIVTKSMHFELKANDDLSKKIQIKVPDNTNQLAVEISVESDLKLSDAMRKKIPVYPSKKIMTSTKTFHLIDESEKDVVFDDFMKRMNRSSIKNIAYTVKYNTTPVYSLMEVLPKVNSQTSEFISNPMSKFYFNCMMRHFKKQDSHGVIQAYFKQSENSIDTVRELANIDYSMTPWSAIAEKNINKERLILQSIDSTNLRHEIQQSWKEIMEFRNPNGGFNWVKDSSYPQYGSLFLTTELLVTIQRLSLLGALEKTEEMSLVIYDAIRYTDSLVVDKSLEDLNWLYMRSLYRDIPFSSGALAISKKILNEKEPKDYAHTGNLKEIALLSVINRELGFAKRANQFNDILRKRATISQNMGMYWANNRWGNPIEVQLLIMEALDTPITSQREMEQMKFWILTQKRKLMWDGMIATRDALYALLVFNEGNAFQAIPAEVTVGKYHLNSSVSKPIIEKTYYGKEIKESLAEVHIESEAPTTSYGALYWQYYNDLDQIEHQNNGLSITRSLFLRKTVGNKIEYLPLNDESLQVGDVIRVELEVEAEDNFDFIKIEDERAATLLPIKQSVSYELQDGIFFLKENMLNTTNIYVDRLPKGKHVISYDVSVGFEGDFLQGAASVESYYAPAFKGNSAGGKVKVR